jgi:hypothetical protein
MLQQREAGDDIDSLMVDCKNGDLGDAAQKAKVSGISQKAKDASDAQQMAEQ